MREPFVRARDGGGLRPAGQELEKAVELVGVTPECRREPGGIGLGGRFERANLQLQAVAEALDAPEDLDGVPLRKTGVEQFDVVPDAGVDSPARVDQLERQVRRTAAGTEALLPRDRERSLDYPILVQLRDRSHRPSLGSETDTGPSRRRSPTQGGGPSS